MTYHDWHGRPGYFRDITRHFSRDDRILDVGCGTAWLAREFVNYTGIDSSSEAFQRSESLHADLRVVDLTRSLPFESACFDGVILKDVLEHLMDPFSVVGEVRRVLRPGGRVFASAPDAQRWVWNDYTHVRPFTRTSFRRLFNDAGFDVERVGYESVLPGTSHIAVHTGNRRPLGLRVAAWLPGWRRNVWLTACAPSTHHTTPATQQ